MFTNLRRFNIHHSSRVGITAIIIKEPLLYGCHVQVTVTVVDLSNIFIACANMGHFNIRF